MHWYDDAATASKADRENRPRRTVRPMPNWARAALAKNLTERAARRRHEVAMPDWSIPSFRFVSRQIANKSASLKSQLTTLP